MFSTEELQQIVYFLEKCVLNGNESIAHATILVKIRNMITESAAKNE